MGTVIPSLEASLYLTDVQSKIAYQLRRYAKQPKDTVPILPNLIISLPDQISRYRREPETLTANIQSDLQGVYNRVFAGERNVTVKVGFTMTNDQDYDINVAITYTLDGGGLDQFGASLSLDTTTGQLKIPEDVLGPSFR